MNRYLSLTRTRNRTPKEDIIAYGMYLYFLGLFSFTKKGVILQNNKKNNKKKSCNIWNSAEMLCCIILQYKQCSPSFIRY